MKIINEIESLHPGNFAMVMATGIVSVALGFLGFKTYSDIFAAMAVTAWIVLLFLCSIRLVKFYRAIYVDLTSPRMVFAYFTLVAATNIVGILAFDRGYSTIALSCWFFAFFSWCLLLYLAFSVLTFLSHENNVNIMHGGWLITIVGTQSLVLLGTKISPGLGEFSHYMMLEVHSLWGLGLVLYGIFATLFCYRIFFLKLNPQDLSPLVWVVMGAAAISVNAGTSLIEMPEQAPFLEAQKAFIDGSILIVWSWATWWIPMLTLFGIWKHLVRKIPLSYEPALWSMAFPLGMYTVASVRIGQVSQFEPMTWVAKVAIWYALLAWTYAFIGLMLKIVRIIRNNTGD